MILRIERKIYASKLVKANVLNEIKNTLLLTLTCIKHIIHMFVFNFYSSFIYMAWYKFIILHAFEGKYCSIDFISQ